MRKSASEDVGRQIGTSLAAQRAFGHDPGVRHRHDRRRNVFAAAFATNGVVADTRIGQVPHWNSIGEQKANISTVSLLPTNHPRRSVMLSHMSSFPYSVSVVLDREFGPRLRELLKDGPVWAVDSPTNRDVAQELWAESPNRNHLDGITVFKAAADRSPAQVLTDEIDKIDMHHGVYSADPAYTVIRIVGCELNPAVQETLANYGFDTFNHTAVGFEARRPLPPPLGQ